MDARPASTNKRRYVPTFLQLHHLDGPPAGDPLLIDMRVLTHNSHMTKVMLLHPLRVFSWTLTLHHATPDFELSTLYQPWSRPVSAWADICRFFSELSSDRKLTIVDKTTSAPLLSLPFNVVDAGQFADALSNPLLVDLLDIQSACGMTLSFPLQNDVQVLRLIRTIAEGLRHGAVRISSTSTLSIAQPAPAAAAEFAACVAQTGAVTLSGLQLSLTPDGPPLDLGPINLHVTGAAVQELIHEDNVSQVLLSATSLVYEFLRFSGSGRTGKNGQGS